MTNEAERTIQQAEDNGFTDHESAQLRRLASLPLVEKLRWLEEAHRLVLRLRRDRA